MSKLAGHHINNDKGINSKINELVNSYLEISKSIEGPRDPNESFAAKNKELVDRAGSLRGRPLFYDYVGTGAGRGVYVELEDGSVKMDLINGIGIHIMGHGHPNMIRATLEGALSDIVMQGNLQFNSEWLNLAEKLVSLSKRKSRLEHVWITTSGSMANENALKMARQKNSPASKVIAMNNAFAGRSTLMTELSDNPAYKVGLPSYADEVLRVSFYDGTSRSTEVALETIKKHIAENPKDIAAFMFEPMLGEGGYKVAPKEFFIPLLEECKKNGVAVWADEIQTFCRTGEFFAYETIGFGDYVDLCTVAKTVQVGATFYTEEYNPQPGLIAGTFAGSTTQLKAGLEVLNVLEKEGYIGDEGKISKIHCEFVGMLVDLNNTTCKGLLTDAGGLGLMVAVTPFDGSKEKQMELLKVLYKNGLMTFGCGRDPFRIRFLIPAVMTTEDIVVAKKIIEKSVLEIANA